ncbi:hypothetical protein GCM10018785_50060 [Streptomyces longispororuber]|uniref:Terpene synthase n=1 Tax=Streptomyces longispororuber TaxID=68230 RepID=A0A919DSF9_9ACTN|nr:terpene synthase family protein [Streptomyces longispororuber]GHE75727.1 hypothetical protein GCM10018785_50060 [Streptomyces longispororuber]
MQPTQIPRFCSEAPPASSPHAAYAEEQTRNWAVQYGIVGDEELFSRMRYGNCASYAYPRSAAEILALCAQWIAWGFLTDDQHTRVLGLDARAWSQAMSQLRPVLSQGRAPEAAAGGDEGMSAGLVQATADLCDRTRTVMSPQQWERFCRNVERYLEGMCQECSLLAEPHLTVEQYSAVRRLSVGIDFYAVLVELEESVDLPAEVYVTEVWRNAVDAIVMVFALGNDLVSHPAEAASGEINNLVLVAGRQFGLSTAQAVDYALQRLAVTMDAFRDAERRLPGELAAAGVDPGHITAARQCAMSLPHMTDGFLTWCEETYRYQYHLDCAQGRAHERHDNLLASS